jgi:AcrR family transcriptional regulator
MPTRTTGDAPVNEPLSLRERNKIRARQEMLQAALAAFAEEGYGSATLESIAARAGAAKATVYAYFPQGREQLFRELYEEVNLELINRGDEVYSRPGNFAERVEGLARALFEIAERPLVGRFYSIEDPALDEALNPVRGHASSAWAALIAADLVNAKKQGELTTDASPDALATVIVGALRAGLSEVARGSAGADDLAVALRSLVGGLGRVG